MRNNKGFTMIELLAAIVILSILVGISIPIVASLLDNSRSKMYINDAKKLIAQADYKLRSSSSFIEKPDEGDCIIMTMAYLDTSEFDSPPNGGEYEKDSSFVVIKNNNGIMEYSVSVVEKLKGGGFKGLELVRKSELLSNNAPGVDGVTYNRFTGKQISRTTIKASSNPMTKNSTGIFSRV